MEFDNSWRALVEPWRADRWFDVSPLPRFDPAAIGFCAANAWWLAELSRLAYRGADRGGFLPAGLVEERVVAADSSQCAVLRARLAARSDRAFAVLVFRGTSEVRDWLLNLRAIPARWPNGGRVHRGFRRALRALWPALEPLLRAIDVPLFYTGHSLGGALATLAASLLPPRAVYTFGAPRVGDEGFGATLARTASFRVVNQRDIVPTLPPAGPVLGFRHAGELHHIVAPGRVVRDGADLPGDVVDGESLRELCDARRWYDPKPFLADHAPVNYVAHLERLL